MTRREFVKRIAHDKKDMLADFIGILKKMKIKFCVIGGLAVNAYAEPVVSLDLDIIIVVERLKDLLGAVKKSYTVKTFANSINIFSPRSDLRVQIQTDPRYQEFIPRAVRADVLGYKIPVASIEDVLRGKIWAAIDKTRRMSKRQKDIADILRLLESKSSLMALVPEELKARLSL
jgi:hypothetical protein